MAGVGNKLPAIRDRSSQIMHRTITISSLKTGEAALPVTSPLLTRSETAGLNTFIES